MSSLCHDSDYDWNSLNAATGGAGELAVSRAEPVKGGLRLRLSNHCCSRLQPFAKLRESRCSGSDP